MLKTVVHQHDLDVGLLDGLAGGRNTVGINDDFCIWAAFGQDSRFVGQCGFSGLVAARQDSTVDILFLQEPGKPDYERCFACSADRYITNAYNGGVYPMYFKQACRIEEVSQAYTQAVEPRKNCQQQADNGRCEALALT